jgi:hypothetical protein
MDMWQLRHTYGPYAWTRTSQAFYSILSKVVARGDRILEFGSATGHISFRMAREGHDVALLDIRTAPVNEARRIFMEAKVHARFYACDFLQHHEQYDIIWNSGLLQCLTTAERERILAHATSLSRRLLLFYPATDSPDKIRGADRTKTPGVEDALEHSVEDLPGMFCHYYDKVCWGRLQPRTLELPFAMHWLYGERTCA